MRTGLSTLSSNDGKLKVLIVDYSVGFGGATKSIGLVIRALQSVTATVLTCQEPVEFRRWYAGLAVHVFRRTFNYQNLERVRATIPKSSLGWIAQKAISVAAVASYSWNALRLIRLLRRYPVDLIHLNNGYVPGEVLWVARLLGIPVVAHVRGLTSISGIRSISDGVSRVVTVSQFVAQPVKMAGYPEGRTSVIWDPVDLALFVRSSQQRPAIRAKHEISDEDIAVGFFGRVVRWKGTLEFVRACICAMRSGARIRPVVVGDVSDGVQEYFDEVRAEALRSPFADRFVFAGFQPEPAGYYHAMDIVAHTSIAPEPFGMVVPEGMSAGKPVIAAAAGGPLEVVEHGVDGLLTSPGDVPELAAAITRLATDTALRERMGASGLKKANTRFAVEPCATALYEVWRSALVH